MARKKKDNPLVAILLGPAIAFVAMTALWHNEGRFDYYKAAKATTPVGVGGSYQEGATVSMTGPMDRELTLAGDYVSSLVGYLTVRRSAQIYSWEENKDSDGDVGYSLGWNSHVESISRNHGVHQRLSARRIAPDEYRLGEWRVDADRLDIVDPREPIPPQSLTLSENGQALELTPEEDYFYLRKGQPKNLGDERISYSGIPVPAVATYFGDKEGDRGVAHVGEVKTGWISQLIHDMGLLHHLAAGEREAALKAVKASLARLKWLVRAIGTFAVVMGYLIFFSGLFSILLYIPLVNRIAELGILIASLVFGIATSLLTITVSYTINHPIVLLAIVGTVAAILIVSRNKRQQARAAAQKALVRELGHLPSARELAERQFAGMARVALADGQLDDKEKKLLQAWAERRRFSGEDVAGWLAAVEQDSADAGVRSEQDLQLLVQLALADQDLSPFELKKLYQAGEQLGYTKGKVRRMVTQARAA